MNIIQQNNNQVSLLNSKFSLKGIGLMVTSETLTNHIRRIVSLAVSVVVVLVLLGNDWIVQTAMAAPKMLDLKVTGPQTAQVDEPLYGIDVQLANSGSAMKDARLRFLIVRYEAEAAVNLQQAGDIKVEVQEGNSWVSVPLDLVAGGVMGAIGAEGTGHKEPHKPGGFPIPVKLKKLLHLRVTFRLPGTYQYTHSVSPNNGDTHFAQPSTITIEAL
jgi:hypothetical protein